MESQSPSLELTDNQYYTKFLVADIQMALGTNIDVKNKRGKASLSATKWHPYQDPEKSSRYEPLLQQKANLLYFHIMVDKLSTNKTRTSDRLNGNQPKQPLPANRTRSNPTAFSKEEIINMPSEVKNAQSGKKYLEGNLLIPVDEPIDKALLATTLLHITQLPNTTKPIIEAIRAVAFILEEIHVEKIADSVASSVLTAISPKLSSLQTALEDMKHVTDTHKQSTIMTSDTLTQIRDATESLTTKINSTVNNPNQRSHSPSSPRSYSDTLKNGSATSAKVYEALKRAEVRSRQILLTPTDDHSLHTNKDTNGSIAQKLQLALEAIGAEGDPLTNVKSVILLHNNLGILFEVNSTQAADWIKKPQTKQALLTRLDLPAEIKDRLHSIIVPYVPISLNIADPTSIGNIESENNLPPGSVASARWIKPYQRRAQGQKTAYAVFSFSDPGHANSLLRDGLIINMEKLHPRKDKKEPIRCVKCQKWGHVARTCKATQDVCGTCGNLHRTNECNHTKNPYCTNCRSDNHPSYSRNCPDFLSRCDHYDNTNPENQMPYFPTDEPWTQVLLPPKNAPYVKHQPYALLKPQTFRQMTLDLDKLKTTIPSTQRPQRARYEERTQVNRTTPRGPQTSTSLPSSPILSPSRPDATPDASFHSATTTNELNDLFLGSDTSNE